MTIFWVIRIFKIQYPEHNLVRTRCQIALAKDMQRRLPDMERIVRACVRAEPFCTAYQIRYAVFLHSCGAMGKIFKRK